MGFEPTTSGTTIRRSNQLNYSHRGFAFAKIEHFSISYNTIRTKMNKKNQDLNYSIVNEEIIKELKKINLELHLSMNGITAEIMAKKATNYKLNQGVSWIRIKEIAKNHNQNSNIATILWQTEKREQQLIATLLVKPQEFDSVLLEKWMKHNKHYETSDALAKVIAQSNIATSEIISWIKEDGFLKHMAIQSLNSRMTLLDDESLNNTINVLFNNTLNISQPTANAIINTTLKILRLYPQKMPLIRETAEKMTFSDNKLCEYIRQSCLEETFFIDEQKNL